MAEYSCKMTYIDGACENEPEYFIGALCTNPGCRLHANRTETLCIGCLQFLQKTQNRTVCDVCKTGMIITTEPVRIDGKNTMMQALHPRAAEHQP